MIISKKFLTVDDRQYRMISGGYISYISEKEAWKKAKILKNGCYVLVEVRYTSKTGGCKKEFFVVKEEDFLEMKRGAY